MPSDDLPLFNIAKVDDAIAGTEFHGHITHLSTALSTMDLALHAARSGARRGVWIADEQLAGRGRGANAWHSPAATGLYMTALTSPPIPTQSAQKLSFRVAIAVQSAIASVTGLRIRDQIDIRWPNDLMIASASGRQRKVGGILIDTASNPAAPPLPAMLRYALIGIGINLNQTAFPPELDAIATSLRREVPKSAESLRREPLAAAILNAVDSQIRSLATNNEQPTTASQPDFARFSTWLRGKRVRVEARDNDPGGYTGTTAGLDSNGFLRVAGDDGQQHTVLSGGLREL